MDFEIVINILFEESPENKNEFAKRVGLSRFTLRNYMLGKTCPTYNEGLRIIMDWELGKKEPEEHEELPVQVR